MDDLMHDVTDRIERSVELAAPPARVWRALTDHREFGTWFRANLDRPFEVGKTTAGNVTYPGYEHIRVEAEVTRMEPERLFAFMWHPYPVAAMAADEPRTTVEFRLQPIATGTRLTVTESGFDALPHGRRDEVFRMNSSGWAGQMENIRAHVDG